MSTQATDPTDPRAPWARDLLASVVVFLVALPLCMGIAIASGVPPALGLVTGVIGGLVVGALAGSPLQVSGPAAGLAVIIFQLVEAHGLAALGPVVLLAGAIQFAAGALGLGQWFRAVSPAVIQGMLAGIGVLIFAGQFHVMIDDAPRGSGWANLSTIPEAIHKAFVLPSGVPVTHRHAALIGLATITLMAAWGPLSRRLRPALRALPAALVGVLVTSAVATGLALEIRFVDVPGGLFGAIMPPTAEALGRLTEAALLGQAFALALIASAETLLCATATDAMHKGPRTDYDKELRAQGVGNVICGVLGALPMTGVIVRSSANVQAGAVTRRSAILHGAWLLLLVALVPAVLGLIPTAALAAVLVFTGYKLVNPDAVKRLRAHGWGEVAVWGVTVGGVVLIDLLTGVLLGFALATLRVLLAATRLEVEVGACEVDGAVDVRLHGTATFLAIPRLARALEALPPDGPALRVCLDQLNFMDAACQDFLRAWGRRHADSGGRLEICWDTLRSRLAPLGGAAGPVVVTARERPAREHAPV